MRAEKLSRMRFEGQHRQLPVRPRRMGGPQHGGVAAMHAVKIAQCYAGAARRLIQVSPISKYQHRPIPFRRAQRPLPWYPVNSKQYGSKPAAGVS
jgi:hypothetical protein